MDDFSHLSVEFFTEAVHNPRLSKEEGRAVFDTVEKIRIRMAGDKHSEFVAPAHSPSSVRDKETGLPLTYAQLHYGPYEAFQRHEHFKGQGTPLSELAFIPAGRRKELEAANVYTAEALAGLDGTALQKLGMGSRSLKEQAQAWLDKANGSADAVRLAGENVELREKMEAMQKQIAELLAASKGGDGKAPKASKKTEKQEDTAETDDDYDTSESPFAGWDEDTLRLWIEENGGEKPHHKCGLKTLIRKADELNNELAERNGGN